MNQIIFCLDEFFHFLLEDIIILPFQNPMPLQLMRLMLNRLKEIKNNNDFLKFLSSNIRNSIAHKTYFFKDGLIHFCDGIFDNDPIKMKLDDFMIESKNMNILALSFMHIWRDMFLKSK